MRCRAVFFVMMSFFLLNTHCSRFMSLGPAEATSQPALPPVSSMAIPSLGDQAVAKKTAEQSTIAWSLSTLAVSYWSLTVQLALVEPATLFALCHTVEPQPVPEGSGLVWTVRDTVYSATLTGRVESDGVHWSMSVSGGGLEDFLWFEGISSRSGDAGSWQFYDTSRVNDVYPASITFSYSFSQMIERIRVEVVKPADSACGSYLDWSAVNNGKSRMRSFTVHDQQKPETVLIAWDAVTEAGFIENTITAQCYCWDTRANGHRDISCP